MQILDWSNLGAAARKDALARPAHRSSEQVSADVRAIIAQVRAGGDQALHELTQRFDGATLSNFAVDSAEFATAQAALTLAQHRAIETASANIERFHRAQMAMPIKVETMPGVICERLVRPIRAVGLYVPAGSAPLPSTALMLAVPAAIAGCPVRIMCTAPRADGRADPAVLVAARKAGIDTVFKLGGAQAIAAMAYGTESVPKCDKVFGPGNAWVTAAKMLVAADPGGAAFDLPAGVTEVMVLADATARAEFIAADLLAQAEHSPDAQALLVTTHAPLAAQVGRELVAQIKSLSRQAILRESLQNIRLLVVADTATALGIANDYAPEHLILEVREPRVWLDGVSSAGSVFLGHWSPESIGDYCSGTNHTLPTYGYARAYSGLALEDFQKRITVQELSPEGLAGLGPTAQTLAALEGLDAHAAAVTLRLRSLAGERR
jgi:histidinol dehydrogenase